MIYIDNPETDVYFNLAAEQYLLHHFDDDILMIWRNENAVVLGKHQVAYAEINYRYVKENEVKVARRITGGGTVYHDLGNLNFTFIEKVSDRNKMIDFKRFLIPVQTALLAMGIKVEITSTNDLTLQGKKISGNAEHVFQQQKKVIHHGTILFDSNLETLGNAIRPGKVGYTSKAVNSNRASVTSIRNHTDTYADIHEFMQKLKLELLKNQSFKDYRFNPKDLEEINTLKKSKFSKWDWNFGYSPTYSATIPEPFGLLGGQLDLKVKHGKITEAHFVRGSDSIHLDFLIGVEHREGPMNDLKHHFSRLEGFDESRFDPHCFF